MNPHELPGGNEPSDLAPTATAPSRHRHRRRRARTTPEDFFLRAVDGGLAAAIFLLPMVMGGRQALGALVLSLLAVGVSCAWLAHGLRSRRATWRWSWLEGVFAAAVLLLVLQIVPLPTALLAWLAPHTAQVLPLWSSTAAAPTTLGSWSCVSFTPGETREGLLTLLSYCLLFVVTIQRIQRLEDVERLLRWCAWSAVLMASFGVLQFLTSNGKFFWFYQHPYSDTDDFAKGSFVNRNHFADFLTLGLGPLIWWIQKLLRHRQLEPSTKFQRTTGEHPFVEFLPAASIVALGVVVFACLLSLSRGGMGAMLLAAVIASLVCYRAGTIGARFLLSLAGAGLLVGVCLMIFGEDRVSNRLADMQSCSFQEMDHGAARRTIWKAVVQALPEYAVMGAGVGCLQDVYPRYLEEPSGPNYYTHAENGPLQIALETGVPGIVLLLAVIGACAFWCLGGLWRNEDRQAMVCSGVILASLTASLAHSLVDFNWYCPGCMVIVVLLAACACRLWQLARKPSGAEERLAAMPPQMAVAMLLILLLLGGGVLYQRIGPVVGERYWFQVRLMDLASDTVLDSDDDTPASPESSPNPPQLAGGPNAPLLAGTPQAVPPGTPLGAPAAPVVGSQPGLLSLPPTAQACWQLAVRPLSAYGAYANLAGNLPPGALLTSSDGSPAEAIPVVTLQMTPSEEEHQATMDSKNLLDLLEVVRWQPDHARAHLRMAGIYLRQFHRLQQTCANAMPLNQIREAAFAARNAPTNPLNTRAALDAWMQRAFGEHCKFLDQALEHTHAALALDPLIAEGYLYLGELCFLEGGSPETKQAYLQQALLLDPHDPTVLFSAGTEAWLAGQLQQGLEYWRASFHGGKLHQEEIINRLAGRAPPQERQAEIQFLLDFFQPDFDAMRLLDRRYAEVAQPEELVAFHQAFARAAEEEAIKSDAVPVRAAQAWLTAHTLHDELGDYQRAHSCAQKAMNANPNNFALRYRLGRFYLKLRQYDEAKRHLEWCLNRKPHNAGLEQDLLAIQQQRILRDSPAATGLLTGFQR